MEGNLELTGDGAGRPICEEKRRVVVAAFINDKHMILQFFLEA